MNQAATSWLEVAAAKELVIGENLERFTMLDVAPGKAASIMEGDENFDR